jgi:hypothetical protein
MKYPRYLLKQYGGSSRKFEGTHRARLRAAQKALEIACYGCAFTPSMKALLAARQHMNVAVESCRTKNWKRT